MKYTFATVQLDATRILLLHRARTIIIIEETTSSRRQPWLNKVLFFWWISTSNDRCTVGGIPCQTVVSLLCCLHLLEMLRYPVYTQILSFMRIKLSVLTEEIWNHPDSKCSFSNYMDVVILAFLELNNNVMMLYVSHLYSEQLTKVKLPESFKYAKTLSKLEKLMTTQRELVEELRLVCTFHTLATTDVGC